MKHLKLFESKYSPLYVKNMVKEYFNFTEYIEPAIIEKYLQLLENPDYEPEFGDAPYGLDTDNLSLTHVGYSEGSGTDFVFQFVVNDHNDDGEIVATFYIDVSQQELNDMITKIESKKYNL